MSDFLVLPGRFSLAIGQATLDTSPVWTSLDATYPNLVTSYTIERGRSYELDRTDVGRATVSIADVDGILDPTNVSGPYYGDIEPLMQAAIGRRNPVTGVWYCRYRGFVEDFDYVFDPSQKVNRLELTLVDLFEVISSIEMHPGHFGDTPPSASAGQVFFEDTTTPVSHNGMQLRVEQVLTDAGIDVDFYVCFSGNVDVHETVYSPGESAMTAISEACDAEFPGVGNVYCDRLGRLAVHGRYARFDPISTAATTTPDRWDFHEWKVGDGAQVAASPTDTAHLRGFSFNYGLSKVINRALAAPIGVADAAIAGQVLQDSTSISKYGIRPWTATSLITKTGVTDGLLTDLQETKLFGSYYVSNYATPQKRVTACVLRSIAPASVGAAANWDLLSKIDIGDLVDVWVASPGGGGFEGEQHFVEGIHEDVRPLNPYFDDVTLSLDLSPATYFADSPFEPLSAAVALSGAV